MGDDIKIENNVVLSEYTTFKIGGPARYFCRVKNEKELLEAIRAAKEKNLPYFVLGGGSNILFSDNGYKGLVIKMENADYEIKGGEIYAQAGAFLSRLLAESIKNNLTGLEWAIGIPGTVGGAICGNAGAFAKSFSGAVKSVRILDKNFKTIILNNADCGFAYRESRFKKTGEIILSAELELAPGDEEKSRALIKKYLIQRAPRQPKLPSAGCVFKNPKPLSAGSLIEEAGLKGKKIGGAMISDLHANFIINLGGAKASDIVELIELAKKEVKEKFNVELEEEVRIIPTNYE